MSTSTQRVYKRAWALCQSCMIDVGLPSINIFNLPLKSSHILTFLSYLNIKGLAPSTITTYISAIGFVHRMNSMHDPTASFIVQKILSSINKIQGNTDSRLPITQFLLHRLLDASNVVITNRYHSILIKAMFSLAFYGLFRIGEITIQNSGEICLFLDQCNVFSDRIVISISNSKIINQINHLTL